MPTRRGRTIGAFIIGGGVMLLFADALLIRWPADFLPVGRAEVPPAERLLSVGTAVLAADGTVVGKVSGIIVQVKKGDWSADQLAPAINHTIEVFGWDRVMWAGDWPVCTLGAPLKDWLAAAKQIVKDKSAEQQRKLFHDNAARFYGL